MADPNDKQERRKQQNREAAQKSYWKKKNEQEELEKSIAQRENEQIQLHRDIRQVRTLLHELEITRKRIVCVPTHVITQSPPSSGTHLLAISKSDAPSHEISPPSPSPPLSPPPPPSQPSQPSIVAQFTAPHLQATSASAGVPATVSPVQQGQYHELSGFQGMDAVPAGAASMQFFTSQRSIRGTRDHDQAADHANANPGPEGFPTPQSENNFSGFALDASRTEHISGSERRSQRLHPTPALQSKDPTLASQHLWVNQDGLPNLTATHASQGLVNFLSLSEARQDSQTSANFLPTSDTNQNDGELEPNFLSIPTADHANHGSVNFLHSMNQASPESANISQLAVDCSSVDFITLLEDPDLLSCQPARLEQESISVMAPAALSDSSYQGGPTTMPASQSEHELQAFLHSGSLDAREPSQSYETATSVITPDVSALANYGLH